MTTKYLDENGLRHLLSEIRSDVTPIKDGTAAVGTSKKLAKADHVHPKVTPSDIGAIATNSFTSRTGKPTANLTPSFGGTATISQVSQATSGQISVTDRTITIPDTLASSYSSAGNVQGKGLVTYRDYIRVDATRIAYAVCYTAADTAAKSVNLNYQQPSSSSRQNYAWGSPNTITGSILFVKFNNAVPANATLTVTHTINVNSTASTGTAVDAAPIKCKGEAITNGVIKAGDTAVLLLNVYADNGSYFDVIAVDRASVDTYSEATTSVAGLMSAADKTKLNGIAAGAEVNVQSDWNQTTTTADDYIKNKPTSMTPTSHTHGNITNDGKITNVGAVTGNVWRFIMADAGGNLYRAGTPFDNSSDNAKNVLKQSGVFEALEATDIWYDTNVTVDEALTGKADQATVNEALAGKVDKVTGKGLSTNDYTTTEKNKLAGIAANAEVNQNAFSNVAVGSTTLAAESKTDTLTLEAGGKIRLTPNSGIDKITIGTETYYAEDIVYGSTDTTSISVKTVLDAKAPKASPAFTGTPTAPTATAGTNTTQIATTAFVSSAISTAITGAVAYQGTVPITGQTGGFAPTNTTAGWYWIVQSAGTYAGVVCEAGDMIFCKTASSTYSASNFDVIQTNLDIATMTNAEIESAISA